MYIHDFVHFNGNAEFELDLRLRLKFIVELEVFIYRI